MVYCQEENEKQETKKMQMSWRPLSKKPVLPYHLYLTTFDTLIDRLAIVPYSAQSLCSFRGWQHRPHSECSRGCCRRGESTLPFCCGCNTILQTGEYPQSRGSWWYTRPCAQSMRIPTSRGFYRYFQSVPLSVCGSLMLQKIHHFWNGGFENIPKKNKITCWTTGGPLL